MNLTPEAIRNMNWEELQSHITPLRQEVYDGLTKMGGPVTTRALASFLGIDLLTVRPRVTELVDLGLARPCGACSEHGHKREGLYQAVPVHVARAEHDRRHAEAKAPVAVQPEMALGDDKVARGQGDTGRSFFAGSPLHPVTLSPRLPEVSHG